MDVSVLTQLFEYNESIQILKEHYITHKKRAVTNWVIHQLGGGSSGPALLIAVFGETGPRCRRVSDLEAGLIG